MELTVEGLKSTAEWEKAAVHLPLYDIPAMRRKTYITPKWLHFGAGNIFRGYIAALQDTLLNKGLSDTGIVVAEMFDTEIIQQIYNPYDNLVLRVTLHADGSTEKRIIGSLACSVTIDEIGYDMLRTFFTQPTLQIVSFTITEKGYTLYDMTGKTLPTVERDMQCGPEKPEHSMAIVAALLYRRFKAGAHPLALVSMDNCSHNGEKLRTAILNIVRAWTASGKTEQAFYEYAADETRVSFPWTMIDKITPRPAPFIAGQLQNTGISGMAPVTTAKNTFIAPFVNTEEAEYLVIEDSFPAGRPPLEEAGVYFTSRETVNNVERMKVTTCLNPLHTALAVYGCLLGYTSIADEMKDGDLYALVARIGYDEGLPAVVHPDILDPKAFIDEVLQKRFPNPFIPDTPQRIATDTSQKVAIRFGETIKAYAEDPSRSVDSLTGIPLVLAGWLRYTLGIDDEGNPFPPSSDPLLPEIRTLLAPVRFGEPETAAGVLTAFLHNSTVFGCDLVRAGVAQRIEAYFVRLIAGKGAVRNTLREVLQRSV